MIQDEPCNQHSTTVQVIQRDPEIYQCPACGWFIGWVDKTRHQSDDIGILKKAMGASK